MSFWGGGRGDLAQPVLTLAEMDAIKRMEFKAWKTKVRVCVCVGGGVHVHTCFFFKAGKTKLLWAPGRAPPYSLAGRARPQVIDTTFAAADGPAGLQPALDRIASEAEAAVDSGYSFVVLSDRAFGPDRVPVSGLLATGRVHHHLVQLKKRSRWVAPGCLS